MDTFVSLMPFKSNLIRIMKNIMSDKNVAPISAEAFMSIHNFADFFQ